MTLCIKSRIVLASASPRRRELLDQIGLAYRVMAVDVDETPLTGETPERAASGGEQILAQLESRR